MDDMGHMSTTNIRQAIQPHVLARLRATGEQGDGEEGCKGRVRTDGLS